MSTVITPNAYIALTQFDWIILISYNSQIKYTIKPLIAYSPYILLLAIKVKAWK